MKPKPSKPAPNAEITNDLKSMFPEAAVARALGKAQAAPVEISAFDEAGIELADVGAQLRLVRADKCDDNPFQTRSDYDEEGHIEGIVESFNRVGQLQPGIARPHPNKARRDDGWVQLAAGHSRLRAVRQGGNAGANLPEPERFVGFILLLVRPLNDIEMAVIAIEENEARAKPRVVDRAKGWLRLKDLLDQTGQGTTWVDYAESKGVTYRRLRQLARLVELPESVQQTINDGIWNEKHGRALLDLEGHAEQQRALLTAISEESLSGTRAVERASEMKSAMQPSQRSVAVGASSGQSNAGGSSSSNSSTGTSSQSTPATANASGQTTPAATSSEPSETANDSAQTEAAGEPLNVAQASHHLSKVGDLIRDAREEAKRVNFYSRLQGGERYGIDFALRNARTLVEELKKLESEIKLMEMNDARE